MSFIPVQDDFFQEIPGSDNLFLDESGSLSPRALEPTVSSPLGEISYWPEDPIHMLDADNLDDMKEVPNQTLSLPDRRKRKPAALATTPLELSRDELLSLTSNGLQEYAHQLQQERPLTTAEEKQLKRQRRLIKNRESAQLSRLRKKLYVDELEQQVSTLTQQNTDLKEEVTYLRGLLKDAGVEVTSRSRNTRTAGVCLLIMLFAFGLFFTTHDSGMPLPVRAREAVPEVALPYHSRTLKSLEHAPFAPDLRDLDPPEARGLKGLAAIEEKSRLRRHPALQPEPVFYCKEAQPLQGLLDQDASLVSFVLPAASVGRSEGRVAVDCQVQDISLWQD